MELKYPNGESIASTMPHRFNCTFMELKYIIACKMCALNLSFNCTFMELK